MDSMSAQPPVIVDASTDHERDIAAIKQVVADAETAFNTNDPDLMTAHFARNASVVNIAGVHVSGSDALLEANRQALAGFLRDAYVRYEVGEIVFIRPDIAIAHKHARAADADGELVDVNPTMIAVYVLVNEQGRWWIASRQNTLVRS